MLGLNASTAGRLVRYRLSGLQCAVPAVVGGLLGIGAGIFGDWRQGSPVWHSFIWGELRDCVGMGVLLAVLVRFGSAPVALAPDGVTVARWRKRVIRWADVAAVDVVSDFPGFRIVVLTTVDGKRVKLPAPLSFLDWRFDEKVRVIHAYWSGWRPARSLV